MIISSLSPDITRVVFFSTGAYFSLRVLDELVASGYPPVAIVVPEYPAHQIDQLDKLPLEPPTPANLLMKAAQNLDISVIYAPLQQSENLDDQLSSIDFDFILVACWPYKLSDSVCALANKAALNLHPSLLPKYKGANPVDDQIKQDESHLGVSLHLLSDTIDSGDIVKKAAFELAKPHTRKAIEQQAAKIGGQLFVQACQAYGSTNWHPQKQEI